MSAATGGPPANLPRRILVVENDAIVLADHMRNLVHWGFRAYQAAGRGEDLIANAKEQARQHRCHLALVDMRLVDNEDASDQSGLRLIKELAPLPAFVVSGYGSLQTASQAIRESGAIAFIGKEEGPRRLRSAIEKFFQDHCRDTMYGGEVRWAHTWKPEQIIGELFEADVPVQPDEIECVVRRLFNDPPLNQARTLRLATITGATRSVRTHSLRHSVVFKASADDFQPVFIKFAPVEQVEAEQQNYLLHIKNQLPGDRHSDLKQHTAVGFVGGVRYGFMGPDIRKFTTLAERLPTMTEQQVRQCLETFFRDIWRAKYHQRKQSNESLFCAYKRAWGEKWVERMRAFPLGAAWITFHLDPALSIDLPNPIAWLQRRVGLAQPGAEDVTAGLVHYTAVTHGDLHCRNIFVDKHDEPWVIDYERTGEGPILRDFVELELDLLLQYLEIHPLDDASLRQLFAALLQPKSLDAPVHVAQAAPDVARICEFAGTLRSLACTVADVRETQTYYWGLLFDIALVLTHLEKKTHEAGGGLFQAGDPSGAAAVERLKQSNRNVWSLLLFGAMICRRLDYWDKAWPAGAIPV